MTMLFLGDDDYINLEAVRGVHFSHRETRALIEARVWFGQGPQDRPVVLRGEQAVYLSAWLELNAESGQRVHEMAQAFRGEAS